ncbi:MAG: diaminopimelate epimerase [Tidjanibacter sp.]|nr:diaminopimelate epimerase [Tidjanibacter sp.]
MTISFHKYEGAGNDFVLLDGRNPLPELSPEFVALLCNRRFGIGADGLMVVESAEGYDFRMRYFNSDGYEGTMCGNGGRCITLYAHLLGIGGSVKRFIACDGEHTSEILSGDGHAGRVRLQMSDPSPITPYGEGLLLNTGSPHYVEVREDIALVDMEAEGAAIRYSEPLASQGGANINFIEPLAEGELLIRTYERGVEAETLACGTGATAAALVAAITLYPTLNHIELTAPGGVLEVDFERSQEGFRNVHLSGPARLTFAGEFEIQED